jgi:hypothetical protein
MCVYGNQNLACKSKFSPISECLFQSKLQGIFTCSRGNYISEGEYTFLQISADSNSEIDLPKFRKILCACTRMKAIGLNIIFRTFATAIGCEFKSLQIFCLGCCLRTCIVN